MNTVIAALAKLLTYALATAASWSLLVVSSVSRFVITAMHPPRMEY